MRFQFTIRRLLLATTAFAAALGLCAPFDPVAVVFAFPISCVVLVFVLFVPSPQRTFDCGACSSRKHAVLAGVRRGALLGAKWMATVTGTLAVLFWIVVAATFFYRRPSDGDITFSRIDSRGIAWGLYAVSVLVGFPTLAAAVFGALIMGIGGGVGYRHVPARPEVEKRPPSDTSQDKPQADPSEA